VVYVEERRRFGGVHEVVLQVGVLQRWGSVRGQREGDGENDPAARFVVVEPTAAVGESALIAREDMDFPGRSVQGANVENRFRDLLPIRADVLHRRRTHTARYPRQTLDSLQLSFDALKNERIPIFTCPASDVDAFPGRWRTRLIKICCMAALHRRFDDKAIEAVVRNDEVTAAAENESRNSLLCGPGQRLLHNGFGVSRNEVSRIATNAEGRIGSEGDVFEDGERSHGLHFIVSAGQRRYNSLVMDSSNSTPAAIQPGTVYLIGAGPGDPGLITVAGRDALAKADVILYDRLAHPSLLNYARPDAERIFVGKASARHYVRQEDTNALMAEKALAGKTVARLKGGDPNVFGRGGEEAEYLRERGVPFVFIPGISSAIAAPTYAGIPVTHRDAASSFAVITGHERDDKTESGTRAAGAAEQRRRWDRIAHAADTLIFLMGVEALDEITARLIENGRAPQTPVALVQWGTWPKQRVVTGTLENIVSVVKEAGITAPAVTVIGEVVRWRERLRWFDTGPLFGKRVLVTRAREQASAFVEKLRALGADPIEFPTIQIAPPADGYAELDAALRALSGYDWVVFTSANGVRHTFERLAEQGKDARAFGTVKVAAIGPATAEASRQHGICADFTPTEFVAEAVAAQFPESVAGKRILIPRAEEGREVLPETWRAQGATVDVVPAYRNEIATDGADDIKAMLANSEIDVITFTSSSTVKNFVESVGGASVPATTLLAAIGPVTAATCRELIREPDCTADASTLDGLINALVQRLNS
jgi:uroporphyrinogen III methyltransferase / synthase